MDVGFIEISGTGKLVFERQRDITVKTLGIMVKDQASLIIGSEDCKHEDLVNIIIKGTSLKIYSAITHARTH